MHSGEHNAQPELSVIIPTKNRNAILVRHLDQLIRAINGRYIEVIVVNDSDAEIHGLPGYNLLRVVKNPSHGVASARNFGARLASSNLLMFLDDDMIVFDENITAVQQFHSANSGSFLNLNWIYPPIVNDEISKRPFGRYLNKFGFNSLKGWNRGNVHWNDEMIFETEGITSQNLSVEKKTFFECGGYSEDFPYAGFEDHEFSSRIKAHGRKIYIDPRQVTYHDESDRIELNSWLARKYRGGISRRIAVHKGFKESGLKLSFPKRIMLLAGEKLIYPVVSVCNNALFWRKLDHIFFRGVHVLLSIAIYGGYFSKEAEKVVGQLDD